jgi:hypothetical protein
MAMSQCSGNNLVNVTLCEGIKGLRTDPDTLYFGWVTRIPLSAIQTHQSQEWHDNPDIPASIKDDDGIVRYPDWQRFECIQLLNLHPHEGLAVHRIPYVPKDAVPRPSPACKGERSAVLQVAYKRFQQDMADALIEFALDVLESQRIDPLTPEERNELLAALATARMPFVSPDAQ